LSYPRKNIFGSFPEAQYLNSEWKIDST